MHSLIVITSFSAFLILFVGIGVFAARSSSGSESEYLLGNRSFGKYFIGIGAGAAANSGFIMVGAVGLGYSVGVSTVLYPLGALIGDWLFWQFFPARVHETARLYNCNTVPELLNAKTVGYTQFNVRSIAALIAIVFVSLFATGQILAAGKVVSATFNLSLIPAIFVAALVIISYCARGGLKASVWSSFVQGIIILVTVIGLLVMVVMVGNGIPAIIEKLRVFNPDMLNISYNYTGWTMVFLLMGMAGMAFGFDLSAPHFIVRILSGRSSADVNAAKWIYLGFLYFTWIGMALFGVMLRAVLPDLDDPEQAVAIFSNLYLNPWLIGVVMAGIFSAIASTFGAQLLAISSSIAVDVMPSWHEIMMDRFGTRYQYFITVIVGLILIIMASNVTSTVFHIILFSGAALAGAFAPVMIIVVLNLRTTPLALLLCMLAGLLSAILWRLSGMADTMLEALPGIITGLVMNMIITKFTISKHPEFK